MTALVAVGVVAAILVAPVPVDDPTPSPSVPYQIPGPGGPELPGNQILPPVCAQYMPACGFHYDPGTGTWRPSGGD